MKVNVLSWQPGQRKSAGPIATQEIELTKKEEAALGAARELVKKIDADLAQRNDEEFLSHLLQNAVMREGGVKYAIAQRNWADVRENMQSLDKYIRTLNIIIHKLLDKERERQAFLNQLLILIGRITELQIRAEKTLSEEE